jgi:hypothetical protein
MQNIVHLRRVGQPPKSARLAPFFRKGLRVFAAALESRPVPSGQRGSSKSLSPGALAAKASWRAGRRRRRKRRDPFRAVYVWFWPLIDEQGDGPESIGAA